MNGKNISSVCNLHDKSKRENLIDSKSILYNNVLKILNKSFQKKILLFLYFLLHFFPENHIENVYILYIVYTGKL